MRIAVPGHRAEGADNRPDFLVFLDLIMGKGDSRWGFIHVGNGDGEGLLDEEPSRIGATHTDAVRSIRLEIERFRRLQRIAGDSEGSVVVVSVACHQRVMVRIGAIWIAGGKAPTVVPPAVSAAVLLLGGRCPWGPLTSVTVMVKGISR